MKIKNIRNYFSTGRTGLLTTGLVLAANTQAATPKESKPNIIMIMVDDLGFSDIGSYGASEIQTPNIDKLAKEGIPPPPRIL